MRVQIGRLFAFLCMLLVTNVLQAQEKKTVTGVVQDSKGTALPNAVVKEKGTNNTALTNDRGAFTIQISSNGKLEVSYVGFDPIEIQTGSSDRYTISLQEKQGALQEVVVTSLGVTRQQKALGYAVSTIKSEDITQAGSPNFASALYGKAPGVRIGTTPGGATSAVNITIRGINSITGKSQPLIVLDGVPIRDGEVKNNDYYGDQRLRGNGLLDINPEDIDNISILKGASAAALYGSEAVNGVVLITTKSGKGKKGFSVDVNANYSRDEVAFLPKYQNVRGPGAPLNVNNAGQDAEGFIYQDLDGDGVKETRGVLGFTINFGPKFDGKPTVGWDGKIRPYEAQKDNYKSLYRTANNSSVNVSMTHASENANVRFSLTRQDNQGVSLGAENTKNIANLNSSFRISKKFTTDVMINYINQHTKNRPYSIDRMINNFTGMMGRFEHADWYLDKYKTSRGYKFVTGSNQSLTPTENIKLPGFKADLADYVWRVKEYNEDEMSNRVIASLTNNWQIINDLKLRARIATDFTSERGESKNTSDLPLAFGYSGYFGVRNLQSTIVYGDVLLTYTKKITPEIEMNVMGGYTATKTNITSVQRETNGGLSVENWFDIKASVNTPGASDALNFRSRLVRDAFIGTINGSYKDFLFLEGTIRRDRTSTMHPDRNSFVYPSVNASLLLSEAFKLPAFVNYGKIRASWGIVGNYPDLYAANIAYTQNTLGVQQTNGQAVLYTTIPRDFGNDAIRPEEKHEIEVGLEAKFLNNRLGIDISYYNGQIRDQILPITIPGSTGGNSILTNIGTLRNKGIEIGLTGAPVRGRDFRWDAGINFAFNKNVVEKLTDGSTEIVHSDYDGNAAQLISKVGEAMGDFYAHPVATNAKGEQIVDPSGLYKLDAKLVKVGNAMPKVVGGFFNTFSYKDFSLDVLMDFRFGGHVMPTGINWMISRGLLEESLNYMDKEHGGLSYYVNAAGKGVQTTAAQGPNGEKVYNDGMLMQGVTANGDANTNVISQAYYYWNTYNWGGPQYSSSRYELYIKKNSYIKMREISLAYSLPTRLTEKVGFKRIQLSVFGRNLFYLYRTIKNMDAEQTVAGSRWFQSVTNAGTNPSTRTFGVMLRAGL
jgi:TonB-linked SusC/RagA family outer membrane protein